MSICSSYKCNICCVCRLVKSIQLCLRSGKKQLASLAFYSILRSYFCCHCYGFENHDFHDVPVRVSNTGRSGYDLVCKKGSALLWLARQFCANHGQALSCMSINCLLILLLFSQRNSFCTDAQNLIFLCNAVFWVPTGHGVLRR